MIDWGAIERAGFAAATAAIERGLVRIERRAKELAPVRKIFGQYEAPYKLRVKSLAEISADRGLRRRMGLGPENEYVEPPLIVVRRAPQNLTARRLTPPNDRYTGRRIRQTFINRSNEDRLDRRGAYEYRTRRAVVNPTTTRDAVGGRLRREIAASAVSADGKRITGRVISPTPYAKYQELGTRHNPAHPYLRPAGHESRDPVRRDVAQGVVAAVKPLFRGRLEVVVKTRAR